MTTFSYPVKNNFTVYTQIVICRDVSQAEVLATAELQRVRDMWTLRSG